MNLYVIGHGFFFCGQDGQSNAPITIPKGISVRFYCKEGKLFDSGWERYIVETNPPDHDPFPEGVTEDGKPDGVLMKAKNDWDISTVVGNYHDYLLTRPGKITPYKSRNMMKELVSKNGTIWMAPSDENDTFYIASKEYCTCRLSEILVVLEKRGFKGTLHWLACRAQYPNYQNLTVEDIKTRAMALEQAKEWMPGDPRKKQPTNLYPHRNPPASSSVQPAPASALKAETTAATTAATSC